MERSTTIALNHAARADLLWRLHRKGDAFHAYRRALSLTWNAIKRRYLRRRISEVQAMGQTVEKVRIYSAPSNMVVLYVRAH